MSFPELDHGSSVWEKGAAAAVSVIFNNTPGIGVCKYWSHRTLAFFPVQPAGMISGSISELAWTSPRPQATECYPSFLYLVGGRLAQLNHDFDLCVGLCS